jgi:hypothetical protein
MAKLFGAQRMILHVIQDSPKDSAGFVTDSFVAQNTRIALADVREWIETLEGEGYVDATKTEDGLSVSITALGRLVLKQFQNIGVTALPTIPSPTLTATPQEEREQSSLGPGEPDGAEDESVPDEFRGMYRGAARSSISQSDFERFDGIDSLLKTLHSDETMRARISKYTPRTQEEDRNVILSCYLHAVKKQISGDYSIVIGDAPGRTPWRTMMCRLSSIPTRENPTMLFLKNVRTNLEKGLFGQVNLEAKAYRHFDPPVPIAITGSLYYNGLHEPGTMGPRSLKSETAWEIGPIISLEINHS